MVNSEYVVLLRLAQYCITVLLKKAKQACITAPVLICYWQLPLPVTALVLICYWQLFFPVTAPALICYWQLLLPCHGSCLDLLLSVAPPLSRLLS